MDGNIANIEAAGEAMKRAHPDRHRPERRAAAEERAKENHSLQVAQAAEARIREVDASGNWMADPTKLRTAALALTDLSGMERQALAMRLRDRPLANTIGGGMLTADALEHDDATLLKKAIRRFMGRDVRLVDSYKPATVGTVAIGIRKSDSELLGKINASLAKLKANGVLDRILDKWGLKPKAA